MRFLAVACLLVSTLAGFAGHADAAVRIAIDLTSQRMHVTSASGDYVWPISTARSGYVTPPGTYAPYSLQRMHYSRKYDNSPMPYSIFFHGGYAIHGTYSVAQLGRPASHGCIRLAPAHAKALFAMVKAEGAAISIAGAPPRGMAFAKRATHARAKAVAARGDEGRALFYAPLPSSRGMIRTWQRDPEGW